MSIQRRIISRLCVLSAGSCLIALGTPALASEDAPAPADKSVDQAQVVYVGPSLGWAVYDGWETRSPSLLRELARQAFLLAARDEMGLATRDPWLASQLPTAGDNPPFELIAGTGDHPSLDVVRGFGGQQEVLLSVPFEVKQLERDVPDFVVSMESASRTAFVDLLKQQGFRSHLANAPEAPADGEKSPLKDKVEQRLGELNECAQFAALRSVHAQLRSGTESQQLLGQLVRGYAQIGVLTELCWTPTHKVFKARALLYAQRMTQKYPGPAALDHLALAQALAGLPGAALETLGKAATTAEQPPAGASTERAPWHAALEAYCRIDTDALDKLCADQDCANLTRLMKFMALEQAGCNPLAMQYGLELLNSMPGCQRIYAGLNRVAGVGLGHLVTQAAPAALAASFRPNLLAVPGLPLAVRQSLRNWPDLKPKGATVPANVWTLEATTITALLDCGQPPAIAAKAAAGAADEKPDAAAQPAPAACDDNEPRWELLGLVLREVAWEQIWRRAWFERSMLGVPPDHWLEQTRPLADIHPWGAVLQLMHWKPEDREEFVAAACKNKPLGIELPGLWLGFQLRSTNVAKGDEFMTDSYRNSDETAFELTQKMTWTNHEESLDGRTRRLLAVSPHSPIAQSRLIARAFDEFQAQADQWEQAAKRHPRLALGFARHYAASDPDRAEKLLRPAAELSHEMDIYLQLAKIYETQGNEEAWLATLEEFLKQPVFGLEHAQVQAQIADHFTEKGDWQRAKPYAEGAAGSYSGWGLYKAARVNEALRNWAEAEQYYQAVSTRYRGENLAWFYFCRRTGMGNRADAKRVAAAFIQEGDVSDWALATYYALNNQSDKAMQALDRFGAKQPHPYSWMELARLADREKQVDRRDANLKKTVQAGQQMVKDDNSNNGFELVGLARLIVEDLKQGGHAAFDVEAAEKNLLGKNRKAQCNFHWFLGSYLDRSGKPEAAIQQWKQCLACSIIDLDARTLAGAALIEHGVRDKDFENPFTKSSDDDVQP